jgi:hypothetical protein
MGKCILPTVAGKTSEYNPAPWPVRLEVRIADFHSAGRGAVPLRATIGARYHLGSPAWQGGEEAK